MRRVAILPAYGIVVALAFVACGGSSARNSTPAASADAPYTNGATATAAAAPQRYHEGTSVPFVAPDGETQCRLRRALLTKADLPSGLAESGLGVAHVYGGSSIDCGMRLPVVISGVADQFIAAGATPTLGSVAQWVYEFKPGEAASLIATLKGRCASLGNQTISLPSFGDESYAVHSVGPQVGSVYIRRGDPITVLEVGSKGDLAATLSQLAATADAKLTKVGPMPLQTPAP